ARAMSREPLFDRILELDPELLVPYMVERVGESQRAIRAMLADAIAAGHADGSVRQADPAVMAAAVELTARGYVLGARARDDAFADDAALDELRTMLDRYLAP
ncbi:MAG: TetR/AcrR family transcriptional regulator, partial [Solirubrobacterales bacterium]